MVRRFTKVIKGQGYSQGQSDHTMFIKQSEEGLKIVLIVYVDDIILTGDDTYEMERLKRILATEFEVKNLGQMRYFLGMEVARSKKGICVSQRKYILDLLSETGMLRSKPMPSLLNSTLLSTCFYNSLKRSLSLYHRRNLPTSPHDEMRTHVQHKDTSVKEQDFSSISLPSINKQCCAPFDASESTTESAINKSTTLTSTDENPCMDL